MEDHSPTPPSPAPTPSSEQPASKAPVAPTDNTPLTKPAVPLSKVPSDERMLSALGYFPMVFILPMIVKPKSPFCQMHAKQGLVLSVLTFFILFVLVLIPAIGSLLFLGLIAAIGIGGFQAYSGMEWKVPVLTNVAFKINLDTMLGGATVAKPTTPSTSPSESAEKKELEAQASHEETPAPQSETPAPTPDQK